MKYISLYVCYYDNILNDNNLLSILLLYQEILL